MNQCEHLFNLIKKPWVVVTYFAFVVISYFFFDKPIALYFHHLELRNSITLNLTTALGKWHYCVILLLVSGIVIRYGTKNRQLERKTWFLLLCLILANAVGTVLKISFGRARPDLFFNHQVYGLYWFKLKDLYWSLPSGHMVTTSSLAAGLSLLFPRYCLVFLGFVGLIALTRMTLCFHYLSDVMSGVYLGLILVSFFSQELKKRHCLIYS